MVSHCRARTEYNLKCKRRRRQLANIYIFIHHNMIERTEQKVQQKSTPKKEMYSSITYISLTACLDLFKRIFEYE